MSISSDKKKITIGFTVGVWDVFHHGHIEFLKKAKTHCDYLHVGIMTDYWVQVQKGPERPMESLQKRMESLRTSGLADNIVVIDTLDMSQYLQMCNVWIKGMDQKNMRPFQYPNEVFLNRTDGVSSSEIIELLKNNGKK